MVLVGEFLERPTYRIIETIREGNTSVCHLVEHEIFRQTMVQKTVSLLGLSDALAHREPCLLNELKHPHIVEVKEAQWDPTAPDLEAITFTMPFYQGGSLYDVLIGDTNPSIGEAIRIVCHVFDALHYLHEEKGLLHRDVKPGNVFLSGDHSVAYLGDLGSACAMSPNGSAEAKGGSLLYKAPESAAMVHTRASDLYSVGLILLELLNGRFRYEDLADDVVERRVLQGKRSLPERMLKPGVHVPSNLCRIISQLLAADPGKRPHRAIEAQRSLEKVVHLDWRKSRIEGEEFWFGSKRNRKRTHQKRDFKIVATNVTRGKYAGQTQLTAEWKPSENQSWRKIGSLARWVSVEDDASWRSMFADVSDVAHRWAAK